MKLNIYERLTLLNDFLPQRANYEKAVMITDIKNKIKIKQEEITEFGMTTVNENGKIISKWNERGNKEYKDFEFTKLELKVLREGYEKMNGQGDIDCSAPFITLCDKILDPPIKRKKGNR